MAQQVTGSMLRFDPSAFKVLLADTAGLLPPGDRLLRELLRIPMLANLVNEWLTHASNPGLQVQAAGQPDPNVKRGEAIHSSLQALDSVCASCEGQLATLLGPLTRTAAP